MIYLYLVAISLLILSFLRVIYVIEKKSIFSYRFHKLKTLMEEKNITAESCSMKEDEFVNFLLPLDKWFKHYLKVMLIVTSFMGFLGIERFGGRGFTAIQGYHELMIIFVISPFVYLFLFKKKNLSHRDQIITSMERGNK